MTDTNERLTNTLDRLDSVIELMEEYLKEKQEKEKKLTEDNTVGQFMEHEFESESIALSYGGYSRKVNLVKVADLHQKYFKFCRVNNLVPLGVRNFQKIVIDQYSPNPQTITTIYSGYNRFEFLEYFEAKAKTKPITYSNDLIEEFINSLIDTGDIDISFEATDNPVTETLYREYVKYLLDNYPDDTVMPVAMFKLVLKDQFMPDNFSDGPIKYYVEFIHDTRVETLRRDHEKKKLQRPKSRILPHTSNPKENTN